MHVSVRSMYDKSFSRAALFTGVEPICLAREQHDALLYPWQLSDPCNCLITHRPESLIYAKEASQSRLTWAENKAHPRACLNLPLINNADSVTIPRTPLNRSGMLFYSTYHGQCTGYFDLARLSSDFSRMQFRLDLV
jgi:hypothetical protein